MTRSGEDDRRLLVVMRHAKAEQFSTDDHGRALTDRGRRDAAEAGAWLAAQGIVPDCALVSSSTRTVATWEALARASRSTAAARIEDSLYSSSPETTLDVLRTAGDCRVLAYVGHNPTAAYLAHMLDDGDPDPAAFREMSEGYPTAALAVLEVRVPWAELDVATAHITGFHVGRGAGH
ncbi:MAG TPA: histidine phosphatase family protein [Marmoricola sp.]